MLTVYTTKADFDGLCPSERVKRQSFMARELLAYAMKCEYSLDIKSFAEKRRELGKPCFEGCPIFFSLSHSGNYLAVALSPFEVGVDIERIGAVSKRVAERFLTDFTNAHTADLSDALLTQRFTEYESMGKLFGCGIPHMLSSDGIFFSSKEYDGYIVTVASKDEGSAVFKESLSFTLTNEQTQRS